MVSIENKTNTKTSFSKKSVMRKKNGHATLVAKQPTYIIQQ